ncbi:MAG: acyl-CoA synthetase [Acidimicrobiales bacterium]
MSEDAPIYYPGHVASTRPDHPAVVMAGSGDTLTYAELDASANRLSHWLRSIGLEPGDHVAFCMENRLEYLPIMWGCHYAGLIYTAISSRLNASEVAYIVNNCGAKAMIVSPYVGDLAESIIPETPDVIARLAVGGAVSGHDAFEITLADQPSTPLLDRVESTDMLYSSGTTGRPKGVKTDPPAGPLGQSDGVTRLGVGLFGMTPDTVYLSPGPLYHAAPLRFCRAIHRTGGTVVVMERFDAEDALAAIETHRVTMSQWVPTMFVRMLKLDRAARDRYDVSSLESAIHAAAPCAVDVKERMIEWWGPIIHEYYAGTEGNGLTYANSEEWLAHRGTVGRAMLGVLHIVDADGNECPSRTEGGVYFSDGSTFEYHDDAEKTAESHLDNGWSTLGDVGWVDEDGYLYLTDRKAYTIIVGGMNVYPQEAENALTMHPEVFDVAVFGVPDDEYGEEVKAVVQPVEMPADADAARALEVRLIAHCRDQLSGVKCPRSVDFRAELPRHPTGKLYKRLLKDEYWADNRQVTT